MRLPQRSLLSLQGVEVDRLGFLVAILVLVGNPEIVGDVKRDGIVLAQGAPRRLEALGEDRLRLLVAGLLPVQIPKVGDGGERILVLVSEQPPSLVEGPLEQALGLGKMTEPAINLADRAHQLGPDRVVREVVDPLRPLVEGFPHGHLASPQLRRVGFGEQVFQELGHVPLCRGFLVRPVALGGDATGLHRHGDRERDQDGQARNGRGDPHLVPLGIFSQAVRHGRRSRQHEVVFEETAEIGGKLLRRRVAPRPVLRHRLERDPVQVAVDLTLERGQLGAPELGRFGGSITERGQSNAGARRLVLADLAHHRLDTGLSQLGGVEGQRAHEQLVEHHPQRVDVGAGVDALLGEVGLLRAHVGRRPHQHAELRVQAVIGQVLPGRLGHAEIDQLRQRLVAGHRHEHVGGLDVAVDHGLVVRVLHTLADLDDEVEPLTIRQVVPVAVLRDRDALHVLHHEVRTALQRGPGIVNLGDHRVVHQRQRLAFDLEAGDRLFRVHPLLDDLQGYPPTHRLALFGEPDFAHPSLAQFAYEPIGADRGRGLAVLVGALQLTAVGQQLGRGPIEERVVVPVGGEQGLHALEQDRVAGTLPPEKRLALVLRQLGRGQKESLGPLVEVGHPECSSWPGPVPP